MEADDLLYKLDWKVRSGSPRVVRELLNSASTLNISIRNTELLHSACKRGNPQIVRLLLDSGADAKTRNGRGATPLHVVYYHACEEIIGNLIRRGADINAEDVDGRTPLHCAIDVTVVESLLHRGSKINAQDIYGRTPLHYATSEDVLGSLLYHGAKINMADRNGDTPLHLACRNQDEAVIEYLLCSGANMNCINGRGCTPLSDTPSDTTSFTYGSQPKTETVNVFESYFIKMNAAGILKEEENQIIPLAKRWSAQKRKTFRQSCAQEIAKLKERIGDTGFTFYDILMQQQLEAFGDPRVEKGFNCQNKKRFPIYWRAMQATRKSRKRLLSQSAAILSTGAFRRLPEEITILICDHLKSNQLEVILKIPQLLRENRGGGSERLSTFP